MSETSLRSDPETGGRILTEYLARADVPPERRGGFVTGLLHDDELTNTVHRRLSNAAGTQRMAAEWIDIHAGTRCGTLQNFANRVFVKAAPGSETVAVDATEYRTVGDLRCFQPCAQRPNRASFGILGE